MRKADSELLKRQSSASFGVSPIIITKNCPQAVILNNLNFTRISVDKREKPVSVWVLRNKQFQSKGPLVRQETRNSYSVGEAKK